MNALYVLPAIERDGTKGTRKDARRNVRNSLGTSSDAAPNLAQALNAAESLRRIIDLASGGRYGLAIVRPTFDGETGQTRHSERWTFKSGAVSGIEYLDGVAEAIASQVHEPVTETRRRETHLREEAFQQRWPSRA